MAGQVAGYQPPDETRGAEHHHVQLTVPAHEHPKQTSTRRAGAAPPSRAQVSGPESASASVSSSSGSTPPSRCFSDARITDRSVANSAVCDMSGSLPGWVPAFSGSGMRSLTADAPRQVRSHVQHATGNPASQPTYAAIGHSRPARHGLGIDCGTTYDLPVTSRPAAEQHLRDLARLRRVRDRIDREYAQPLDVEALARGAHMSAGHLSREFKLAYGESPYSYLMTRRIERAMALLRRGDLSVTEVCFAVGCSSLGTFSTRFTELVGVPPSVYRHEAARATAGMPSCVAKQVTRPIRNREAPAAEPHLK